MRMVSSGCRMSRLPARAAMARTQGPIRSTRLLCHCPVPCRPPILDSASPSKASRCKSGLVFETSRPWSPERFSSSACTRPLAPKLGCRPPGSTKRPSKPSFRGRAAGRRHAQDHRLRYAKAVSAAGASDCFIAISVERQHHPEGRRDSNPNWHVPGAFSYPRAAGYGVIVSFQQIDTVAAGQAVASPMRRLGM